MMHAHASHQTHLVPLSCNLHAGGRPEWGQCLEFGVHTELRIHALHDNAPIAAAARLVAGSFCILFYFESFYALAGRAPAQITVFDFLQVRGLGKCVNQSH